MQILIFPFSKAEINCPQNGSIYNKQLITAINHVVVYYKWGKRREQEGSHDIF